MAETSNGIPQVVTVKEQIKIMEWENQQLRKELCYTKATNNSVTDFSKKVTTTAAREFSNHSCKHIFFSTVPKFFPLHANFFFLQKS